MAGFSSKTRQEKISGDFAEIMDQIKTFLEPIIVSVQSGKTMSSIWKAPRSLEITNIKFVGIYLGIIMQNCISQLIHALQNRNAREQEEIP